MSDCIFCDIIAGELPASVVYEDDIVIAIMDVAACDLIIWHSFC